MVSFAWDNKDRVRLTNLDNHICIICEDKDILLLRQDRTLKVFHSWEFGAFVAISSYPLCL